ncbi:effector-associated domain 2-containing protein [Dactylosporangium sp. CA-233914]|uniref:VMAP-C domain-containing protein n=1 Tax=Dactylosporangium sp. CA-233914 TaxID=3239934 RepID=UPI003D9358B5
MSAPIVEALVRIEATANREVRSMLLHHVQRFLATELAPAELSVTRFSEHRFDLIAIVDAAVAQPGGAVALREAIRFLFGSQASDAAAALHACDAEADREPSCLGRESRLALLDALDGIALPAGVDVPLLFSRATEPLPVQTSAATLTQAVVRLERRATAVSLFRFLELAAAHSSTTDARDAMRTWIDKNIALVPRHRRREITDLRAELTGRLVDTDARTVLLIRVDPVEDDLYTVFAWLGQTDGPPGPNRGPEDVLTLPQLQRWLAGLVAGLRDGALDPARGPLIEFLLPSSCFDLDVDTWPLDGTRLGAVYQVAIRPMDTSAARGAFAIQRWQTLVASVNSATTALDCARWLDSTVPPLAGHAAATPWAWLAITCPSMSTSAAGVDAVLDTGAPVAAWLRGGGGADDLEKLGRGRVVTELPRTVRKWRELSWKAGTADRRRDLVLLWDDPTRPPPREHLVSAPQAGS